jgi:hypothetical protein
VIMNLQAGDHVTIGGNGTIMPYINPNSNNPIIGMLRVHNGSVQVFDGQNWSTWGSSYPSIGLDADTCELLKWCKQQRENQAQLEALMQKHPGLKDLHDKFEVMRMLCERETV